jgi:hypothetical protein
MTVVSLGYRTDLMLLELQGSVIEQRAGYQVIRTSANPTFHWGTSCCWTGRLSQARSPPG